MLMGCGWTAVAHDVLRRVLHITQRGYVSAARSYNAGRPAYTLPAELFALAFSYLSIRERIVASHVCFCWRNISLSTPALWTEVHLPEYGGRMSAEILRRSRAAPLHITVRFWYDSRPYDAVAQHVDRLDSLSVYSNVAMLPVLLRRPAGRLRRLVLDDSSASQFGDFYPDDHPDWNLNCTRSLASFPALQELDIRCSGLLPCVQLHVN